MVSSYTRDPLVQTGGDLLQTRVKMEYHDFLKSKSDMDYNDGFAPLFLPDYLYDFQKNLTEWMIHKGRAAVFADCGLGKTIIQLVWAQNVVQKTNKPVLILTPFSVSAQTIREGEKFGIECNRSLEGKVTGKIVVSNYERLHYFNQNDFVGIVCDECFPPDTPIDVFNIDSSLERKYIKDIKKNDKIFNACGEDYVHDICKRRIDRAVQMQINGRRITCSENHPFFTMYGWRSAQDLQPGDYVMETKEAMRLVREDSNTEVCGTKVSKILQSILLSEMEDEHSRKCSKGSYSGSKSKERGISFQMAKQWSSESVETIRKNSQFRSNERSGGQKESFIDIAENEAQTFRAWGQWSWNDLTAAYNEGCTIRQLDTGICYITGKTSTRFSNMLQSRLSESRSKNSNRGRRDEPFFQKRERQKERCKTGFFRVESVEILEQGHPELEKYRDETGVVYFYDIKAKRHPSFSVNGILVHNSSILKNFDGARKKEITKFCKRVPYRLLCTATAAPNDYIELGTSSEALGVMGYMDMLNRFFKNDMSSSSTKRYRGETQKWRFKRHAENDFWRWVSSWSRMVRKPSDLGFKDNDFILPPMNIKETVVPVSRPLDGKLFVEPAISLREQQQERRMTIQERCEVVAEKVSHNGQSLVWCHLNDEGDILANLIPEGKQIKGSDSEEKKESTFLDFANGNLKTLITKPKIAGFGLNFQNCSHMTFFPSHSWEQFYQGTRRCWRFGQKNPVNIDIVTTEGELEVMRNLTRKAEQADKMFEKMVLFMNNALGIEQKENHTKTEEIPSWL